MLFWVLGDFDTSKVLGNYYPLPHIHPLGPGLWKKNNTLGVLFGGVYHVSPEFPPGDPHFFGVPAAGSPLDDSPAGVRAAVGAFHRQCRGSA